MKTSNSNNCIVKSLHKLYKLPNDWQWRYSKDVCSSVRDGTHDTPKYVESTGIPLITSKNLKNGNIDFENVKFISSKDHKAISIRSGVEIGDVLFAMIGTIGNPVEIKSNKIFSIKNVGLFKKNPEILNSTFLCYWLNSFKLLNILEKEQYIKGTTQRFIPLGKLRSIPIPFPPLFIQNRIVEKIEELFSELDKGVESLNKVKEQLKIYRQSVLSAAFSGKLTNKNLKNGELSKGWKKQSIKELCEINPRLPFQEIKDDLIVSFLPMKRVEEVSGKIDLSEKRKYSEVKKGYTSFTNDDIIFAKITPCMENGKIAIVNSLENKIGFGSTEFHVFRCKNEIINKYLFYFLIQEKFRNEAKFNMTGAVGQKRVTKSFLENSIVPIPDIADQQNIVNEIETRFSVCDKMEETIETALAQSESLRQSILKQAFEGHL